MMMNIINFLYKFKQKDEYNYLFVSFKGIYINLLVTVHSIITFNGVDNLVAYLHQLFESKIKVTYLSHNQVIV